MGINLSIRVTILSISQYRDNIVSWLKYSILASLVIPTLASWRTNSWALCCFVKQVWLKTRQTKESVASFWGTFTVCHAESDSLPASLRGCFLRGIVGEGLAGSNSALSPYPHLSPTTDVPPAGSFTQRPHCVCGCLSVRNRNLCSFFFFFI